MIHLQKIIIAWSAKNKNITISSQDYVKRLWNHSNTKIPVTIGKGSDTAKPRLKAPFTGQ